MGRGKLNEDAGPEIPKGHQVLDTLLSQPQLGVSIAVRKRKPDVTRGEQPRPPGLRGRVVSDPNGPSSGAQAKPPAASWSFSAAEVSLLGSTARIVRLHLGQADSLHRGRFSQGSVRKLWGP